MFDHASLASLDERTLYEEWLLEAVYEIVDRPLQPRERDRFEYPQSGGPPRQHAYGLAHVTIGDWRAGLLKAGAPLVLVTEFKLLDMLVEWVLVENGQEPNYRFSEKIAAIKRSVSFPPLIDSSVATGSSGGSVRGAYWAPQPGRSSNTVAPQRAGMKPLR